MINPRNNILFIRMESAGRNPKDFYIDTVPYAYDFRNTPGINASKSIILVKIEADNMEPTLLPGDVVICQKGNVLTFDPKESAVVILYKKGCIVKRLHQHKLKNYYFLVNDNPSYKKWEEMEKKEILQLLIIFGKLYPGVILKNIKQRFDTINESLEFLKVETSKITKELDRLIA